MSLSALYDLPAPAKLNLFLHVIGRRADGYHLLQSVFRLIDWCDTLHLERRSDGVVSREDLGPALPEDDLCTRAARLLQQATGTREGVHIAIDKQVPWGAGLGGGSSDAATVLLGLNRLWNLGLDRRALLELGVKLGADVPFFIGGRDAWVEGIGEILTPIALPPASYLVLKPPVAIPTAAIFSSPLLRRDTKPATMAVFLAESEFGKNDLQAGAEAYSKQVVDGLEILKQNLGLSRMSGSGSAVFAQYPEVLRECSAKHGELTEKILRSLATPNESWIARTCRSLDMHPMQHWVRD